MINVFAMKFLIMSLFVFSCAHAQIYPDSWWMNVSQQELKSWEIPPQAADRNKNEVILSKRNELGQFSNLADVSFEMDGIRYTSLEGLWQGMKYPENSNDERNLNPNIQWKHTRSEVYLMSGKDAKKAGDLANENMKKLGIQWITYQGQKINFKTDGAHDHYDIIYRASLNKVNQNPNLKSLLLKTKGLTLLPDHTQYPGQTAAYEYFNIYMKIRAFASE